MKLIDTAIKGVTLIEPTLFEDERGYLFEAFVRERYESLGLVGNFAQHNQSFSKPNVVRGMHYQIHDPQAKLVRVLRGAIIDVAVDVRRGSPTFGHHVMTELSAENRRQLFIPAGFAHGFGALEASEILYLISAPYAPKLERGIAWNDPDLAIDWKITSPVLSSKDRALKRLREVDEIDLPVYRP